MPELQLVPKRFLTISPEETTFARRGFRAFNTSVQKRLEQAGSSFLHGYHAALGRVEPVTLAQRLHEVPGEFRGFAFEGAGMSLFLQDRLTLFQKRSRFDSFLTGEGKHHTYMLHVGAGWAMARLPHLRKRMERVLRQMDPLLRWLAVDGFGFHEGYFHAPKSIRARCVPAGLIGYSRRAFDQGLGRSLWFVEGADPERIQRTIATFRTRRRGDLWSGVGLACGYAGGLEEPDVVRLTAAAGAHLPEFAQGVAFAAKARDLAGNSSAFTELACQAVCGVSAARAASITDDALAELPPGCPKSGYESWRRRIQAALKTRKIPQEVLS